MKTKTEETENGKRVGGAFTGLAGSIGKIVADASEKTKDIAAKTQESIVSAVDRNGNGKLDAEDFGLAEENLQQAKETVKKLAARAGQSVKSSGDMLGKALGDVKTGMDRRYLRPVFTDELLRSAADAGSLDDIRTAQKPGMLCIVERDRKRGESEACSGAVGYRVTVKGVELLNLYEDSAALLGICFYPNVSRTIYYADPYQEQLYVCLDEYFDYLKKARVNELEKVAQDLGAKRVRITFKERKKILVARSARGEAKAGPGKASGAYDKADSEYSSAEIAADVKFSGHDAPTEPKLVYFKNESDIERLVQMRMDGGKNKIESKIYRFQCNKSSGMKEKEAVRIDAVLNQLKCSGTASVSSEAQRESRTELEYSIEF